MNVLCDTKRWQQWLHVLVLKLVMFPTADASILSTMDTHGTRVDMQIPDPHSEEFP